jgi:hypothetical protein
MNESILKKVEILRCISVDLLTVMIHRKSTFLIKMQLLQKLDLLSLISRFPIEDSGSELSPSSQGPSLSLGTSTKRNRFEKSDNTSPATSLLCRVAYLLDEVGIQLVESHASVEEYLIKNIQSISMPLLFQQSGGSTSKGRNPEIAAKIEVFIIFRCFILFSGDHTK